MTDLWIPETFASARECLRPIINNERGFQHLIQPFDPQKSPIDTSHLSSALLHCVEGNTVLTTHNVLLPISFDLDAGLAYILNCGRQTMHTNKDADPSSAIVSRTTLTCFKFSNIIFDATHYLDSTLAILCVYEDIYGATNTCYFRFRKNNNGEIDLDHPFQRMYTIGPPYCQLCHCLDKTCTCSEQDLEREKISINTKPWSSYANFSSWLTKRRSLMMKTYVTDEHGSVSFSGLCKPNAISITRVSGWDYIGPQFLAGVMPLDANLINDSFNPFLNMFKVEDEDCNLQRCPPLFTNPTSESVTRTTNSISVHMLIDPHHVDDHDVQQPLLEWKQPQMAQGLRGNVGSGHVEVAEQTKDRSSRSKSLTTRDGGQSTRSSTAKEKKVMVSKNRSSQEQSRSLECPHCGKNFSLKGNMQKHVQMIHEKVITQEKCELCDKSFSTKGNLVKHIRAVHEKVMKYECELCALKFHQAFNFQRHVRRYHESNG